MDEKHINKLFSIIEDNNIRLYNLKGTEYKNITAASIFTLKHYGIFFNDDNISTNENMFLVAAHELGHCLSGAMHNLTSPYELIERNEYRADRCSVLRFLPFDKLQEAISSGCQTSYELSDYLGLPEQFLKTAIEVYRNEGLIN